LGAGLGIADGLVVGLRVVDKSARLGLGIAVGMGLSDGDSIADGLGVGI
jgi:hypothetical protein